MLNGLITEKVPSEKRAAKAEGGIEKHFTEAAVMLAYAFHLFTGDRSILHVEIHPDGQHAKQFDISRWLTTQGFVKESSIGSTSYGGVYRREQVSIEVNPSSGLGDVVARSNSGTVIAECKGGVINSTHAGQSSRLRKGLCETVGLLMSRRLDNESQFAVVPRTRTIAKVAGQLAPRCARAGIRILLIEADGQVNEVRSA